MGLNVHIYMPRCKRLVMSRGDYFFGGGGKGAVGRILGGEEEGGISWGPGRLDPVDFVHEENAAY